MNNYEYIISSLPAISLDWKFSNGESFGSYVAWIKTQLDSSDIKTVNCLLQGFKDENLIPEFYEAALKSGNSFIRDYFTFDLNVRNGKARFLNKAFDRPEDQDTIEIETGEFQEAEALSAALQNPDLLSREQSLDSLMWNKISQLCIFNYFDINAVLAFIAKLRIIGRWLSLDENAGREMFRKLVDEVRGTFGGVEYAAPSE